MDDRRKEHEDGSDSGAQDQQGDRTWNYQEIRKDEVSFDDPIPPERDTPVEKDDE
jgi:hypothetical protein